MNPILTRAAATLFLMTATTGAFAHDYTLGDLAIAHPMAYATTPVSKTTGGFMTITNTGDTDDTLLEVRGDVPRIELHTTEMSDGIAKMMKQDGIRIPAGETVTLEHGGFHVMFMGLNQQLHEGEKLPVTLVFQNAGTIDIEFDIEPRDGGTSGHSGHGN
ncbi:copper chaperone PCu(A)C [Oceaniglobus indicus]|uniref:copper chaperone PCu(A)C n=1 Tax=Oceaniglobus indicus TaxID=2047749 RepID=UPI001F4EE25B|nr:copper chaperone PCu(A)C [Oceaniglobus indicus]